MKNDFIPLSYIYFQLFHRADSRDSKALVRAADTWGKTGYREILKFTLGIAFLGTPFQGSHRSLCTVTEQRVAVAVAAGGQSSQELVKYLRAEGHRGELDELVKRFCEMTTHDSVEVEVVCFYETLHTDFTSIVGKLPAEFAKGLTVEKTGIVRSPPITEGLASC